MMSMTRWRMATDAAFKSTSLKLDEFMRIWGVIIVVPSLAELGAPVDNKAAQANVDFFKFLSQSDYRLGEGDNFSGVIALPLTGSLALDSFRTEPSASFCVKSGEREMR